MSEKILGQILDTLQTMNTRLDQMDARFEKIEGRLEKIEGRIDNIEVNLKSVKADTKEIPFIKMAVFETFEITRQLNTNQARSFESHVTNELNMHSHSIDLLIRKQFKLEVEIERIKGK